MYTVKIKSYRGIESAKIELNPIAIIIGPNGSGKTSVCDAVRAAITGSTMPLGFLKKEAKELVRDGAKNGAVILENESGSARVEWPSAKFETKGAPPTSHGLASGLIDFMALNQKQRFDEIQQMLQTEPTLPDLESALDGTNASEMIPKVWEKIEEHGWDGAYIYATERRATLKGQWEANAPGGREGHGEKYGAAKAGEMVADTPDGGQAEAIKAVEITLEELETVIKNSAVSESKIEELKEKAGKLGAAERGVESQIKNIENQETQLAELKEKRDKLPPADISLAVKCPHCDEPILIAGKKLTKAPKSISEATAKKRREALGTAGGKVANMQDTIYKSQQTKRDCEAVLAAAIIAKDELAAPSSGTATETDIQVARDMLKDAEDNLGKIRCKLTHLQIVSLEEIISALAPDGVRGSVVKKSIEAFNTGLEALSKFAKWKTISLSMDATLYMGHRRYGLLSASEKLRARTTLQVAAAVKTQSPLVVIDGGDTYLDMDGKYGIYEMLKKTKLHGLIAWGWEDGDTKKLTGNAYFLKDGETVGV